MQKTVILNGVKVNYELERKSVKNINLRIRPDGSMHVSMPKYALQKTVDAFLQMHAADILRMIERAEAKNSAVPGPEKCEDGECVLYLGEKLTIRVLSADRNSVNISGDELELHLREPGNPEMRRKTMERWMREQCEQVVGEYCRRIYPVFQARGISQPVVKYRKMRSRWGSCRPSRGELTFNTALVHVPEECIEYVVMHEFTHFLAPNHQKQFHDYMTLFMPDWQKRRKLIRRFETEAVLG